MDVSGYEAVRKKYDLPSFGELDKEFEISLIEAESFILRNVRKKVGERFELVINIVQRILQPDTNSFADMYECKFFKGSEKDAIFHLFKHLMHCYRQSVELEILQDEKSDAEFVRSVTKEWREIKQGLLPFISKLKMVWIEKDESKEHLEYLG